MCENDFYVYGCRSINDTDKLFYLFFYTKFIYENIEGLLFSLLRDIYLIKILFAFVLNKNTHRISFLILNIAKLLTVSLFIVKIHLNSNKNILINIMEVIL